MGTKISLKKIYYMKPKKRKRKRKYGDKLFQYSRTSVHYIC